MEEEKPKPKRHSTAETKKHKEKERNKAEAAAKEKVTQLKSMQCCETCNYVVEYEVKDKGVELVFECHKSPPVIVTRCRSYEEIVELDFSGVWPTVLRADWCGSWEHKCPPPKSP